MAENPTTSPKKPLPDPNTTISTPQNPNLPSTPISPSPSHSQISSPRLPQPQQPQMHQFQQLHHLQQQQNMIAAPPPASSPSGGFQIQQQQQQNMQRSGSGAMPRITQIQQQFGTAATANAMRQHSAMYGGQMNFAAASNMQQQQQQQQMGMSRVGMMGQGPVGGQIPMLSGQAAAAQFNLQTQMLGQARQKAGLVQGSQFHAANASGQALQGMQTKGTSNSLGLNPQIRTNGALACAAQRMSQGQIRQQQLPQPQLSSSPKLPGQGMTRTSSLASMNSQLSGLTQNGQAAMIQNPLSQQQWSKQTQLAMSGPGSSSYQFHQQQQRQQAFLQQQLQKNMPLNQQQISQLIQQQPQLNAQQQQQLQTQQTPLVQQQQMHLQQQQSPRMPGPTSQKSMSLTGSQPDTPGGSSSQGDTSNQLIGKRKIQDLVSQVDSHGKLDPEVEDLLLEMADEFIESVTTFACNLAKHRKSSVLESKDVLLHLEKNWHLNVPGYARDEQRFQRKMLPSEAHTRRMEMIRSLIESSQLETDAGTAKQIIHDAATDRTIRPSPSSEQLISSPAGASILQKVPRF